MSDVNKHNSALLGKDWVLRHKPASSISHIKGCKRRLWSNLKLNIKEIGYRIHGEDLHATEINQNVSEIALKSEQSPSQTASQPLQNQKINKTFD